MKRTAIISLLLLILCIASATVCGFTAGAAGGYGDSVTACCGSGIWTICFSGKDLHIERIAPDHFAEDITLQYPSASAALFDNRAAVLCDDFTGDQMILYTYDLSTGVLDSCAIANRDIGYHRGFYCDGSSVLIQEDDRPSAIRRYSVGGKMKDSFDFQAASVAFVYGYDSGLYLLCDGSLYRFTGSGYQKLGGAVLSAPAAFVARDVIADGSGGIYRVSGDTILTELRPEIGGAYTALTIQDGSIYAAAGDTLYRLDPVSGSVTHSYTCPAPVTELYCYDGRLYAVTDGASGSILRLSPSDFVPCSEEEIPAVPSPITSSLYRVDPVRYRITRIPAQTTFAQLKANLDYGAYQPSLYRGGKNIKGGNVGTAMTVVFSADDDYTYELSVIGDITGEGNVNSRDVGELMDYFLGNIRFDGVYTDAADISDDGKVDLIDLAMLCRMA